MRYFEIPSDQEIQDVPPDPKTGKQPLLTFSNVCDEQVWGAEVWRESDENAEELISLKPQIKGKPVGSLVEMSAKGYELFLPLFTMKGKVVSPAVAVELAVLTRAVRRATEKPPEKKAADALEESNGAASAEASS